MTVDCIRARHLIPKAQLPSTLQLSSSVSFASILSSMKLLISLWWILMNFPFLSFHFAPPHVTQNPDGATIKSISENIVVNPGDEAKLSCVVDGKSKVFVAQLSVLRFIVFWWLLLCAVIHEINRRNGKCFKGLHLRYWRIYCLATRWRAYSQMHLGRSMHFSI